jgi:hypothetical protein
VGWLPALLLLLAGCGASGQSVAKTNTATIAPDDSAVITQFGESLEVDDGDCEPSSNRMADFRQAFADHKESAQIVGCERMIMFHVPVANGNWYYGAVLMLDRGGTRSRSLVCFDEMVGHFLVEPAPEAVTKHDLIAFTEQNCSAG